MKKILLSLIVLISTTSCFKSDKSIAFEKIIFHTSMCFGTCPTYHLEVDEAKNMKLYSETVFSDKKGAFNYDLDQEKMGYFVGKVSDTTFIKLKNELNTIGLDSLNFDGSNCCDGSLKTIIIYYNGKRKYLKAMFPPEKADKLIYILKDICETPNLKRTNLKFDIEDKEK